MQQKGRWWNLVSWILKMQFAEYPALIWSSDIFGDMTNVCLLQKPLETAAVTCHPLCISSSHTLPLQFSWPPYVKTFSEYTYRRHNTHANVLPLSIINVDFWTLPINLHSDQLPGEVQYALYMRHVQVFSCSSSPFKELTTRECKT